jgi:hypothetical protein
MAPVQHVVILAFKPEAGPGAAAAFFADLEVMASQIEGITALVHGPNISNEVRGACAPARAPLHVPSSVTATPTARPRPPPLLCKGLSNDFTHMFIMTFVDAAARDAYLPHAAHEAFKARHLAHVTKVLVVDI